MLFLKRNQPKPTMVRNSLVMSVLIAIAYSQILGGITCCCLVRSLSERLGTLTSVQASDADSCDTNVADVKEKPTHVRCPKCAARSTTQNSDSPKNVAQESSQPASTGEINAPCSCSKLDLVGNESNESPSLKFKTGGADWIPPLLSRLSVFGLECSIQYSSPPLLRPSKQSWQSLVCVWNR